MSPARIADRNGLNIGGTSVPYGALLLMAGGALAVAAFFMGWVSVATPAGTSGPTGLSLRTEGVPSLGIGTDGIHQGLAQEAAYIAMLGASNKLVLAGITINAARLCRVDDKTGSITEGKAADMVALDGNPLEDVSALKRVKAVFQDGKKICLA